MADEGRRCHCGCADAHVSLEPASRTFRIAAASLQGGENRSGAACVPEQLHAWPALDCDRHAHSQGDAEERPSARAFTVCEQQPDLTSMLGLNSRMASSAARRTVLRASSAICRQHDTVIANWLKVCVETPSWWRRRGLQRRRHAGCATVCGHHQGHKWWVSGRGARWRMSDLHSQLCLLRWRRRCGLAGPPNVIN